MFDIDFTSSAIGDIRYFRKAEQNIIVDAITQNLLEPLRPVRNRKSLESNELSEWELRIGRYRVFYDVDEIDKVVLVKAVGWKEHNKLFIRGKEYKL